ncbi:hypothetical protein FQN49_002393 [Arthroderma sp. PD_2]|nr:hypothetical protein FQN49_002393 [Arthroderma sp. PD_2]
MAPILEHLVTSANLSARSFGLGGPASGMVIIDVVMTSVAIALVLNRVVVRVMTSKKLASDDYVIIGSLAVCIAMNVVNIVAVHHGYGRPSSEVSDGDLQTALELYFALQMLYRVTINMTKLSILLLYRKIFDTERFRFKLICDILFVYITLYTVATFLVTIFQCNPIPKAWSRDIPGSCINLSAFWYANAALHTFTDVIILILPMPVIKGLDLPLRQKLALNFVFALGIFVCGTSIARMLTLDTSSKASDVNEGTTLSTLWTTIEANTAIICACLPMIRIPLSKIVPSLFPPFQYSDSNSVTTCEDNNNTIPTKPACPRVTTWCSERTLRTISISEIQTTMPNSYSLANVIFPTWG